jgi:hypothetical protein
VKTQENLYKAVAPMPREDRRSDKVVEHVKLALKRLRISQPLNRIATSSVGILLRVAGYNPESVPNYLFTKLDPTGGAAL